jgi:transposase-like protein
MTVLWFDGWMTRPVGVEVSEADRTILERRVAAATTQRRDWQRATIVLMAAEAISSPKIAEVVGVNRNQVDLWKHRYRDEGLDGLRDRDRPGRPHVYGPEDRLTLVKTITTRPPEEGQLSVEPPPLSRSPSEGGNHVNNGTEGHAENSAVVH